MARRAPVQGHDVSISIMGPNGPELVGEYQEVGINIASDTEEYIETNSKMPILLDGEIHIDGTLKRGWMDMNIVAITMGTANLQPGQKIAPSPRFIIACTINAPEKGLNGRYRLTGCKFEKLGIQIAAGKGVVTADQSYKAEGLIEG